MIRKAILLCLALLLLIATGCGFYHTTSRGRTLTGTLALPFLDNRTSQPDMEIRATEALIEAVEDDGGLTLVDLGEEQYLLTGSVIRYSEAPFAINDEGGADEYKLTIVIELSFRNQELGEDLWENRKFTGSESFFLEGSTAGADLTRERAENKSLEQIVDGVLNAIFGEW